MKYIRTKDDIIDFEKVEIVDREIGTPKTIAYLKKNAIKEADTIEELCDVFIVIDEDKKRNIYLKEDSWTFDMMQDLGMWSDRTCYGAIWTDKGLIYIAKMNDKGEFELL